MIKNMSGFIDPYSLGIIISLLGVMIIQLTDEADSKAISSGQHDEAVSYIKQQHEVTSAKLKSSTRLSTLEP